MEDLVDAWVHKFKKHERKLVLISEEIARRRALSSANSKIDTPDLKEKEGQKEEGGDKMETETDSKKEWNSSGEMNPADDGNAGRTSDEPESEASFMEVPEVNSNIGEEAVAAIVGALEKGEEENDGRVLVVDRQRLETIERRLVDDTSGLGVDGLHALYAKLYQLIHAHRKSWDKTDLLNVSKATADGSFLVVVVFFFLFSFSFLFFSFFFFFICI